MNLIKLLFSFLHRYIFLFLFAVLALPIVALSFFNVPSAADDFCFALNTLKFGFWQGQKYYYDGWTGRYFSTFLMHANPLIFRFLAWYNIFPILTLLGLVHSTYRLFIAVAFPKNNAFVFTTALFFLYLFALPSVVENFFWLPSVVGYPLPLILLNYWAVALLASQKNTLQYLWIAFLTFAIVGSNETPMLVITILVGVCLAYQILGAAFMNSLNFKRLQFNIKISWLHWVLIVSLIVSLFLELSAPGNAVRMSYNPNSQQVLPSVFASLKDALTFTFEWLTQTPLLLLTVLLLPLLKSLITPQHHRFFRLHPVFSILLWIGIFSIGIFPGYYGVGVPPPPRTLNLIYWFFLLGWFYNVAVMYLWINHKWGIAFAPMPVYIRVFFGLLLCGYLIQSPNIRPLYGDLLKGRAATYKHEMIARFEQIEQGKNLEIVSVDSLSVYPKTLFTEDITPNPQHLWNTCQAEFWEVKKLKLK